MVGHQEGHPACEKLLKLSQRFCFGNPADPGVTSQCTKQGQPNKKTKSSSIAINNITDEKN